MHVLALPKSQRYAPNTYYHRYLKRLYKKLIPAGKRVLQVGCVNGFFLAELNCTSGAYYDPDEELISYYQNLHPTFEGLSGPLELFKNKLQPFDYIILSSSVMEVEDVQELLELIKPFCSADTRIISDIYSWFWEPILKCASLLGLRRKSPLKNWLSKEDFLNFLYLAHFQAIKSEKHLLLPLNIPFLSFIFNSLLAPLPFFNSLCLVHFFVARLLTVKHTEAPSVSIVIACKNERGNIKDAIERCPQLGSSTEIIFVDGHSKDGTIEEIQRLIPLYPAKNIRWFVQPRTGKGDAVRYGFEKATGDILMIQDCDLTAPPEMLPKFYSALIENKGEFINGCRLVYGMETGAMRFLNLLANHSFALLFSWLLGQRLKDTLCGTKVLWARDYKKIAANRAYFGDFDPFGDFDLLFGATYLHLKIIDLPVLYKSRVYGTTQIRRFRDGVLLARMSILAYIKFKWI